MAVVKLIKTKLTKDWPGVYDQVYIFRENLIKSCGQCQHKVFTKISYSKSKVSGWCVHCNAINTFGQRKGLSYSLQTEEIVGRTKKLRSNGDAKEI